MKTTQILFVLFLFFFEIYTIEIRDDVPIWPYPKSFKDTKDGKTLTLNKEQITFTFINTQDLPENIEKHPEIQEGVIRYKKRMFRGSKINRYEPAVAEASSDSITEIQVLIYDYDETTLSLGVNEHYEISIPSSKNPGKIEIKAENVW